MNKQPYIAKHDKDGGVFKCPILKDDMLKNCKKSELYFVDNSGFGSENESALTARQFVAKVKAGYGYAIINMGQFQVYIQEYKMA